MKETEVTNVRELEVALRNEGFLPGTYSLSGGDRDNTLCIERSGARWSVYYTERGSKFDEEFFLSESEACTYFLNAMLHSHGNR